jgi:outer membrane lipoprotein-sorting protein
MIPAENIENKIKKLRYETNAEAHERILENVMQAIDKHQEQKSGATAPDIWRTIMKNPITKLAVAAVIIITALVVINQFGIPGESSAFAKVAERLRIARTLTYKMTTNSNIEMEMAFKEPGYMRITMPDGYVTVADWTQSKALTIMPPRQQFYEMDLALNNDPAQRQFDAIEKLRALPEQADEVLGTIEENGRILQGYRVRQNDTVNTVWIDEESKDLVRVEAEFINALGMNVVMTDFRFDVDLDDSLFSLTPPAGYAKMDIQINTSEVTEQDLIEYLRLWSSWTRDNSFPPTFNPIELQKLAMEMERQGRFGEGQESEEQVKQGALQMTRGIMFVMKLPAESNWRYAGENVQFGDAATPVFWYKPAGSQTYRVIYGDLTVNDVAPENLPD